MGRNDRTLKRRNRHEREFGRIDLGWIESGIPEEEEEEEEEDEDALCCVLAICCHSHCQRDDMIASLNVYEWMTATASDMIWLHLSKSMNEWMNAELAP